MNLRERLSTGQPLLLDGAMGTEAGKLGLQGNLSANLTNPLSIAKIHLQYRLAGSEAITTNTFLLNALTREQEKQHVDLDRMNRLGVALVQNVAVDGPYVLGGMGPAGGVLESCGGEVPDADCRAAYLAQAKSLVAEGVDGLIVETIMSLQQALRALEACREVTDKPVMISLSFDKITDRGIRTLMGDTAEACAQLLQEKGASAVGTNCSTFTMPQMAGVAGVMYGTTNIPSIVQPNAGQPHGEQSTYDMTPKEFADGVEECIERGASIVGGCCGTTPEHIRELAERLKRRL